MVVLMTFELFQPGKSDERDASMKKTKLPVYCFSVEVEGETIYFAKFLSHIINALLSSPKLTPRNADIGDLLRSSNK